MDKIHKYDFSAVIRRIMQAKRFDHEYQVADLLGFKRAAFSERKKRNSLPLAEIELFCRRESINLDWVLSGTGEESVIREETTPYVVPFDERQVLMNKLKERIDEMTDSDFYRIMGAFHDLVDELKKKREAGKLPPP